MQWEIAFDICPLFRERESQADGDADLWSETFHHLAAKSVIRDFEQLAEKECEIEHGNAQLPASLQAGCGQTLPCLRGAFQQLQQPLELTQGQAVVKYQAMSHVVPK